MNNTSKNLLVWYIEPNTNKTYPVLYCYAYLNNKFVYEQINNNGFRIQECTITNKKKIFKEVVKDFKMTDEDKKHLHRLLTSFDLDDYIDNENTDNLIAYHYKKSFKNKDTGEINYNNEAVDFFIKYDVGKSIFWKYFWLTILIGSVGSILGNVIWNLPSWICKLIQCFQ